MQVEACVRCSYSSTRTMPMTGRGEPKAPILVIGDIVRQVDDRDGQIFTTRAGEKLDYMLTEAGLDPEKHVYRTTLLRCYAGQKPEVSEWSVFKKCRYHTTDLIKIMKPKAIVLCGMKPLLWMILHYTSEKVDEKTFYKWMGKAVRLKDIWGELKFFIVESPAMLARHKHPENERRCIEGLTEMKAYVSAQLKGEDPYVLDMIDLKRRRSNSAEQQKFNWT